MHVIQIDASTGIFLIGGNLIYQLHFAIEILYSEFLSPDKICANFTFLWRFKIYFQGKDTVLIGVVPTNLRNVSLQKSNFKQFYTVLVGVRHSFTADSRKFSQRKSFQAVCKGLSPVKQAHCTVRYHSYYLKADCLPTS